MLHAPPLNRVQCLQLCLAYSPAAAQPRLAARANFSHSPQRVRQILRDNAALVKRLGCARGWNACLLDGCCC